MAALDVVCDDLVTKMTFSVRRATIDDIPRLGKVIEASVRGLQAEDYSAAQIDGALRSVYGVDSQLIVDGTYFVAEQTHYKRAPL
jgi:hypothetical protein